MCSLNGMNTPTRSPPVHDEDDSEFYPSRLPDTESNTIEETLEFTVLQSCCARINFPAGTGPILAMTDDFDEP